MQFIQSTLQDIAASDARRVRGTGVGKAPCATENAKRKKKDVFVCLLMQHQFLFLLEKCVVVFLGQNSNMFETFNKYMRLRVKC